MRTAFPVVMSVAVPLLSSMLIHRDSVIGGSHCRRMPLTATRVGGPQWGTARTIDHAVAVVLDHKERSRMSPGARRPHRCCSGVIDHKVTVSLHRDETRSSAV